MTSFGFTVTFKAKAASDMSREAMIKIASLLITGLIKMVYYSRKVPGQMNFFCAIGYLIIVIPACRESFLDI